MPGLSRMDAAFLSDVRQAIDDAAGRLLALSDAEAGTCPAPGKWSRKEIIGHLIDSASNNHGRFVRAQMQDDLVFPGYDQEGWVRQQGYQRLPWADLVRLWQAYNHHLVHVMAAVDPDTLHRPRARHNLDQIAWRTVSPTQPVTLDYFMRDYVDHMKHHLRQIDAWSGA